MLCTTGLSDSDVRRRALSLCHSSYSGLRHREGYSNCHSRGSGVTITIIFGSNDVPGVTSGSVRDTKGVDAQITLSVGGR